MQFRSTVATSLITEYFERERLSKIGYRFNTNDLSDTDALIFSFIADCIVCEENKRAKRKPRAK